MEKKCCKNGMNVFFCGGGDCGCQCACEPEPEPTANVEVTVGETGDFKTLREAQQYIRQRACNRAVINLVSDVKEEAGTYIAFNGFSLDPITIINGNKHTLDLSNITGEYGLSVNSQRLRLQNIKIYAPNTTFAILGAGNCAQLHMFGDVIV